MRVTKWLSVYFDNDGSCWIELDVNGMSLFTLINTGFYNLSESVLLSDIVCISISSDAISDESMSCTGIIVLVVQEISIFIIMNTCRNYYISINIKLILIINIREH